MQSESTKFATEDDQGKCPETRIRLALNQIQSPFFSTSLLVHTSRTEGGS
jgi:hypothetical protein